MEGWRCPGCGRCYAPFILQCQSCIQTTSSIGVACPSCGSFPCRGTGTACRSKFKQRQGMLCNL